MIPQALAAPRRCREQPRPISSPGILSLAALIKWLQFLLVKALLIPAKPAALASAHCPARRWLCGHVPKSAVPSGHRSSQGGHGPGALLCRPVIFT